jgi:hypothetical protein
VEGPDPAQQIDMGAMRRAAGKILVGLSAARLQMFQGPVHGLPQPGLPRLVFAG